LAWTSQQRRTRRWGYARPPMAETAFAGLVEPAAFAATVGLVASAGPADPAELD